MTQIVAQGALNAPNLDDKDCLIFFMAFFHSMESQAQKFFHLWLILTSVPN